MIARIDFNARTFLDRVALAAREPVYSAAFAWVFEDGSPMALSERVNVLEKLCGTDLSDVRGIAAQTEWNKIDLLLTLRTDREPTFIAVENKIKASESDRQLANYDESLNALVGKKQKIFLTLAGEQPNSGHQWQAVPYSVLNEALSQQASCGENLYLRDLCQSIGRLTAVAAAASSDEGLAAVAFGDDDGVTCAPDLLTYVESMRLNKIVQRIWMNGVLNKVNVKRPWRSALGETHAQAILDIESALPEIAVVVGLQLQWRTLKIFCRPHPYPSVATPEQNKKVDDILMKIRDRFSIPDEKRPTQPRTRGFRSFTLFNMPKGRNAEAWADLLRKQLEVLIAAFPDAREISRVNVIAGGVDD